MAGPAYILAKGWAAGGAINKFHFVELGANEVVTQNNAQGELTLGVCQEAITADDATRGRIANVVIMGISRVIAGGVISIGAEVTVGADARAEAALSGDRVCGIALQAAAADGDHIDVLLVPAGRVVA